MLKKKTMKKKSSKRKINMKKKNTRKIRGGIQKVYISVQPSALGVRGAKEWSNNVIANADKPIVPKLVSKVIVDNDSGIDIDERIAEIIGSLKDSDKLLKPMHGKMLTSTIY